MENVTSSLDSPSKEMKELLYMLNEIEVKWGITRLGLGTYFVSLSQRPGFRHFRGFSDIQIYNIVTSTSRGHKPEKIKKLKERIEEAFPYDFETRQPKLDEENRLNSIVGEIVGLVPPKLYDSFALLPDLAMAKSFEGLYIGVAIGVGNTKPTSFMMKIHINGKVELTSRNEHYRVGIISSIDQTIYFLLNSERKEQPELYLTSVTRAFKAKTNPVKRFQMCGCWINKIGRPVSGASLLFRAEHLNEIKGMEQLARPLEELKILEDSFFDLIEDSPTYKDHYNHLLKSSSRIHYLNRNSNVYW